MRRNSGIRAITTDYKGYRFRSRTEARWAVYFDADGIKWEYEREGFDLAGERYLPDFWLPQVKMFAEVKPDAFTEDELRKCRLLAQASGFPVLLLDGAPDFRSYFAFHPRGYWYEGSDHQEPSSDYIVGACCDYPVTEGRFFSATGATWPAPETGHGLGISEAAIRAARGARFEFGEGTRS